ncbi:MAG: hypothetical protein ACP5LN_08825 [Thermoproteota archaeon]
MKRLKVLILFVFSLLLLGLSYAIAQPIELRYDDNEVNYFWSDFYPHGAAVKFTPPVVPWKITAVRFLGLLIQRGPPLIFFVELRDKDFNLIYRSSYLASQFLDNATVEWVTIPISNYTVKGDFYVCIYPRLTIDGPQLWIGADDDKPISGRSFLVDGESGTIIKAWDEKSNAPKNFMIRALGEAATSLLELRLTSVRVTTEGAIVSFAVSSKGVILGIEAILHHNVSWTPCEAELKESTLRVLVKGPGNLTVNVRTLDASAGTTILIEGDLWEKYFEIRNAAYLLSLMNSSLSAQLEDAHKKINLLNETLNEAYIHVSLLEGRIKELLSKVEELNSSLIAEQRAHEEEKEKLLGEATFWKYTSLVSLAFVVAGAFYYLKFKKKAKSKNVEA